MAASLAFGVTRFSKLLRMASEQPICAWITTSLPSLTLAANLLEFGTPTSLKPVATVGHPIILQRSASLLDVLIVSTLAIALKIAKNRRDARFADQKTIGSKGVNFYCIVRTWIPQMSRPKRKSRLKRWRERNIERKWKMQSVNSRRLINNSVAGKQSAKAKTKTKVKAPKVIKDKNRNKDQDKSKEPNKDGKDKENENKDDRRGEKRARRSRSSSRERYRERREDEKERRERKEYEAWREEKKRERDREYARQDYHRDRSSRREYYSDDDHNDGWTEVSYRRRNRYHR